MSRAASGLLRALFNRLDGDQDRILLIDVQSVDWQSLTFTGERHTIILRLIGDQPTCLATKLMGGLDEAEFAIPDQIVADIAAGPAVVAEDGSILVTIEALTVTD